MNATPLTVLALAGLTSPAAAATLQVPGTYATVDAAVAAASSGDKINVAAGDYSSDPQVVIDGLTLTIEGVAGAAVTTLPRLLLDNGSDVTVQAATLPCSAENAIRSLESDLTLIEAEAHDCDQPNPRVYFVGTPLTTTSRLEVTDGAFSNLESDLYGAFLVRFGTMVVDSSTFDDTRAIETSGDSTCDAACGGAIDARGVNLELIGSTFTNGAADEGGSIAYAGVASLSAGSITIVDSTFDGSAARLGGAVSVTLESVLSVTGSTFTNNEVTERGGAIYLGSMSSNPQQASIERSRFEGNNAFLSSAAIHSEAGSSLDVATSWFCGNTANTLGSDVTAQDVDDVSITGTVFALNEGDAALYVEDDEQLTAIQFAVDDKNVEFSVLAGPSTRVGKAGRDNTAMERLKNGVDKHGVFDIAADDGPYVILDSWVTAALAEESS